MGQGLQRVAKLCGGLKATAQGKTVHYNSDGKITKTTSARRYKSGEFVYHRYRGRGVFQHFCLDDSECYVLFDRRDSGVSTEGERVTTALLSNKPFPEAK